MSSITTKEYSEAALCIQDFLKHNPYARVVSDSRKIRSGDIFLSLSNDRDKIVSYVRKAAEMGSSFFILMPGCSVVEIKDAAGVDGVFIKMPDSSSFPMSFFPERRGPLPDLKVAVTGTNGKSSTVFFCVSLASLLNVLSLGVGTFGICGYREEDPTGLTTLDSESLHVVMRQAKKDNVNLFFTEASSHGLHQRRLIGIPFDITVFTGLSDDHYDYHCNLKEYLNAKKVLFSECLKRDGACVINVDSEYCFEIKQSVPESFNVKFFTYGFSDNADFKIYDLYTNKDFTMDFCVDFRSVSYKVHLSMIGLFQVYNAVSAAAVLVAAGFDPSDVFAVLPSVEPPKGRMQIFHRNGLPTIVVDYAHNPHGLEMAILSCRKHTSGRVLLLFGCGGERDMQKRPHMGRIAASLSDIAIVTNDNPRGEDPDKIAREIISGDAGNLLRINLDRVQAAKDLFDIANEKDIILIAGKGSESYGSGQDNSIFKSDLELASFLINKYVSS